MAFLQEYTMLEELGKGGFATVYKVRHNELGYTRAIRVLNETIVDDTSKTYQKFLRECKLLLRLGNGNHPNIVHIYQPRLLDNKALVEMDYVDGQDITHYLSQNNNCVSADEVIRMATQISSALAYCHEGIFRFCMDRDLDNLKDDPNDGSKVLIDSDTRKRLIDRYKVIHNDIHSGNIMRREDGNFVLLDFGLAINGDEVVRSSRHTNGAPEFKAPEKWDDDSILTEQSDIYSFGVVMYQYLTGQVPFPYDVKLSKHIAEFRLAEAHQKYPVPSIENLRKESFEKKFEGKQYERDYPQWLEDVIMRCLRKDPSERFKNGQDLYDYIIEQIQKSNRAYSESEVNALALENKNLSSQIETLHGVNDGLNKQLNDSQNSLNQLQQDYRNAQSQIETLNKSVIMLNGEIGTLHEVNEGLNRQLNDDQNSLNQLQHNYRNAQNKIETQNNKIVTLNREIDTLKQNGTRSTPVAVSILLVFLIFYSLGISALLYVKDPSGMEVQITQLNDSIKSKNQVIKNLDKQIDELSSSNKNTVVAQKNKEIADLNAKIKLLEQNSNNKGSDNAEIKRLNDVIAQKDVTIRNLQNEVSKKSSSSSNDDSVRNLRKQLDQKQSEINKLNKEIKEKNKLIEILNGQM